jgi:hypothetical protein
VADVAGTLDPSRSAGFANLMAAAARRRRPTTVAAGVAYLLGRNRDANSQTDRTPWWFCCAVGVAVAAIILLAGRAEYG